MATGVNKFSLAQRVIHWLTLALLLVSFFSHEAMQDAWRAITREGAVDLDPSLGAQLHAIVGIAVLALTVLRLVLRVVQGAPAPVAGQHPLVTIASVVVHGLLYLLLLALPMAGMAAWGGGITEAGEVHEVLFILTLVLVGLHVAAALLHQFVIKDNLIARMR